MPWTTRTAGRVGAVSVGRTDSCVCLDYYYYLFNTSIIFLFIFLFFLSLTLFYLGSYSFYIFSLLYSLLLFTFLYTRLNLNSFGDSPLFL